MQVEKPKALQDSNHMPRFLYVREKISLKIDSPYFIYTLFSLKLYWGMWLQYQGVTKKFLRETINVAMMKRT